MNNVTDYPLLVFVLSFFALSLSALSGASFLMRERKLEKDVREDLGVILAATLTLLGLIIGFTFSMGLNRYDQRRTTRRQKPTRSAPNTCGRVCCRPGFGEGS